MWICDTRNTRDHPFLSDLIFRVLLAEDHLSLQASPYNRLMGVLPLERHLLELTSRPTNTFTTCRIKVTRWAVSLRNLCSKQQSTPDRAEHHLLSLLESKGVIQRCSCTCMSILTRSREDHMACHRYRKCRGSSRCRAVLGEAGPPDSQGDPNVQEGLVQMVRLQIGKERVKESVEEERQKLQKLAEEVWPTEQLCVLDCTFCRAHFLGHLCAECAFALP